MRTALLAGALVSVMTLSGGLSAQVAEPTPADGFAWAAACKDCHSEIYEAWEKTKHARTINRLSSENREGDRCIGCHVTGVREPVMDGTTILNANVQCESCHGAGRAHVEAAKAGNAAEARLVRKPAQASCETCHNDKSPHYRGFFYSALVNLVHRTK
jgi:hypothetical protein